MSLAGATLTIKDGGLGVIPKGSGNIVAKIGICPLGINNVVQGVGSIAAVRSLVGVGPLAEACAAAIAAGAKEVRVVRANPSSYGSAGAVTHTGPGSGTVTPANAPHVVVLGKITTGGTLGASQIAFSVDGGAYGTPVATAATVIVPGCFVTFAMSAGTYVLNEVYTAAIDNTLLTQSGGGPLPTRTASPIDAYSVIVLIVVGGALGVATFKYSTDGGDNYSGEILVPASGRYGIPGTGVMLTFASTFTALDTYSFTTTPASYNTSEAQSALDAVIADPADWTHVHVVGAPSNSAGAATLAAAVDAKMAGALSLQKYKAAIVECPTTEADATIISAVASLSLLRTMVVATDCEYVSQLTGKQDRRNLAIAISARAAAVRSSRSLSATRDGTLTGVVSLYRDEQATPGLDAARLTVGCTRPGVPGFFCNIDRTMAPAGSDFGFWPRRRVMDEACKYAYAALVQEVGDDVFVDQATGKIREDEAQSIETFTQRAVEAALRGDVSAVKIVVDRNQNILATNTLVAEVGIQPKGITYFITATIQYIPTALAA